MLTSDLTVVDNHASLTLPGTLGSKVYNQVATVANNASKRRIAATAGTTPQEIEISHEIKGTGFKARIRTMIRHKYTKVNQDTTLTEGVVPSASATLTFDRPVQSAGAITDVTFTDQIGALLDVVLTSGALAKILNQEF